jgi:hypothetical protein
VPLEAPQPVRAGRAAARRPHAAIRRKERDVVFVMSVLLAGSS